MLKDPPIFRLAFAFAVMAVLSGCNDAPSSTTPQAATMNDTHKTITIGDLNNAKKVDSICALDRIKGSVDEKSTAVKQNVISIFGGWVATAAKQTPAQFTLVLKGEQTYGFAGKTGTARPDVAQVLGSPALANSGYDFTVDLSNIPTGTYQVLALTRLATGDELCDFRRQLMVVE